LKRTTAATALAAIVVGILGQWAHTAEPEALDLEEPATPIAGVASGRNPQSAIVANGAGVPSLEVNRPNLDGYRLVSLKLADGQPPPKPGVARDPGRWGGIPPLEQVHLGCLDGRAVQLWSPARNLQSVAVARQTNAPPDVSHLVPLFFHLRERDASKLTVTAEAVRGSIRFGYRPGGRLEFWVVLGVDARIAGGAVAGSYTWTVTRVGEDHADTGEEVVKHSGPLTGGVSTRAALAEANSIAPDQVYLNWRGDGTGTARPSKYKLALRPDLVSLRWISEDDIGSAWGACGLYHGGYNHPLVLSNRVYVAYYRPSISPQASRHPVSRPPFDCSTAEWQRYAVREADEVLVCMDASTGVTLWKQAFVGDGFNMAGEAKFGPWLPPCIDDGRLFMEGTAGHVYCLDVETGKVLWRWQSALTQPVKHRAPTAALHAGDGVVVNSDGIGLDAKTGQKVWGPSPLLTNGSRGNGTVGRLKWVHEGVTYVVSRDGCVRVKDGRECWTVPYPESVPDPESARRKIGVARTPFPALQGDLLVLPSRLSFNGVSHFSTPIPTICYRMYPDRIEKQWEVAWQDLSLGLDHAPTIYDGHVYFALRGNVKTWDTGYHTAAIELATGKIKSMAATAGEVNNYNHLFCDGGLTYVAGKAGRFMLLHPSGALDLWTGTDAYNSKVVAALPVYDGHVYPAMLDGRLFRRMCDGFVACYDFRTTVEPATYEELRAAAERAEQERTAAKRAEEERAAVAKRAEAERVAKESARQVLPPPKIDDLFAPSAAGRNVPTVPDAMEPEVEAME
jgi:outer membrane protein assembly factor BamB